MIIDARQIVTEDEANQDFYKAARIADEHGAALVFMDKQPKNKLTNLELEPVWS